MSSPGEAAPPDRDPRSGLRRGRPPGRFGGGESRPAHAGARPARRAHRGRRARGRPVVGRLRGASAPAQPRARSLRCSSPWARRSAPPSSWRRRRASGVPSAGTSTPRSSNSTSPRHRATPVGQAITQPRRSAPVGRGVSSGSSRGRHPLLGRLSGLDRRDVQQLADLLDDDERQRDEDADGPLVGA